MSLVPSLTETLAESAADLVVGATDWCSHPRNLDVPRIGGTKNPRVENIVALAPDLVIANEEENRVADLDALRAAGIAVWVTAPTTVAAALVSLDRLLRFGCGLRTPDWLAAANVVWAESASGPRRSAFIPIWRRPWMALGRDTFAGDVLAHLRIDNVLAGDVDRYPKVTLDQIRAESAVDLVVLPDEPYAFGWHDGPEAFADWGVPIACVSGRHLTWYGPSLVDARRLLTEQISGARLPQP